MSRLSQNDQQAGVIKSGYSYEHQCWIMDYVIQDCGHPKTMPCGCYGRQHAGEYAHVTE